MIIDNIKHAELYAGLNEKFRVAFDYLRSTDLYAIAPGKYAIDGDHVFAIVQEYETMDSTGEQMESHRKYTDVQYMISGAELVGHALLGSQEISKAYDEESDFMLYADAPEFFTKMNAGTFMIFFPHDLHMPCIKEGDPAKVKKVVIKVDNSIA